MTDTEIIKALECCTTKGAKCSDCPAYEKVDRSDCKKYFRGAIDLINSQKAEIERLKKLLEEADVNYNTCAKRFYKEAIKEFAEKMKGVIPEIDDTYIERFVEDYIDNLVKEMVGGYMTCKDCIHYDVCAVKKNYYANKPFKNGNIDKEQLKYINGVEKTCNHYFSQKRNPKQS